jgi:hypothetical protein
MAFNLSNTVPIKSFATTSAARVNAILNGATNVFAGAADVANRAAGDLSATATNAARTAGITPNAGNTTTKPSSEMDAGETGPDIIVVANNSDITDNRLRISALRGQSDRVYGANDKSTNVLAPLHSTGGMLFPYTPSIAISGDTDWTPHALTHTNYDIYSYQRTPSATITLGGKFTVQNQREGEYALACIHFLRTMGKMYYGEQDSFDYNPTTLTPEQSTAGLPPPVLRLRGYGLYMFSDLRCVLKNYSFSFEETMDLVTVQSQTGGDIMLPPMFTINVSLLLQQNPSRLRREFKLDAFRTGDLMRQSSTGGWF